MDPRGDRKTDVTLLIRFARFVACFTVIMEHVLKFVISCSSSTGKLTKYEITRSLGDK